MSCGFYINFILATFALTACGQDSQPYIHQERGGLVSVEAEHWYRSQGYREIFYYTGNAVCPDRDSNADPSFLEYSILFSEPGEYRFYLLGNRIRSSTGSESIIRCALYDGNTLQIDSCSIPDLHAPQWNGWDHDPAGFRIENPGNYFFKIQAGPNRSFCLDKFIFSSDSGFAPSGSGPVETLEMDSIREDYPVILPPAWAFGVLYGAYTNQEQTMEAVDSLLNGDFPVDAFWIDSYFWDFNAGKGPGGYIDFVGDTAAYPDPEKLWTGLADRGIKAGVWIWDQINEEGNEETFREFKERGYFRRVYENRNGWHNESRNTRTGQIDFGDPEAVVYWKNKLKPFFDKGLDFLKLDNSAEIAFCRAAFSAGQEMGRETGGRGFILAHISSIDDKRLKLYPTRWTGDAKICWSQPDYPDLSVYAMGGYKENIAMVADPKRSTYEVPFLTHDAGGYDYFGSTEQSDELYTRWIQFAALNSIMTVFSSSRNPTRNHPYRYPEPVRENFRKYTHLRMRLFPYIYSSAMQSRLTGRKMVQGDGVHEYQFTLGDALLVAPVYVHGSRRRTLFLPQGQWIDFETDSIFEGKSTITVDAPLNKLPLFVRSGSIIPMRNYARSIGSGTSDTMNLHIYPSDDRTEFNLYEDDGSSNDYLENKFSTTVLSVQKTDHTTRFQIGPATGWYRGMNPRRTYVLHFHLAGKPDTVYLDGKLLHETNAINPVPAGGWKYERDTGQLVLAHSCLKEKGCRVKIVY